MGWRYPIIYIFWLTRDPLCINTLLLILQIWYKETHPQYVQNLCYNMNGNSVSNAPTVMQDRVTFPWIDCKLHRSLMRSSNKMVPYSYIKLVFAVFQVIFRSFIQVFYHILSICTSPSPTQQLMKFFHRYTKTQYSIKLPSYKNIIIW